MALESFGSAAYFYLMREQEKSDPKTLESTAAWHFLAFFVSAGLFSGLVSHAANAKILYPRVIAQLTAAARATPKTETWASAVAAASNPAAGAAVKEVTKTIPRILPSLGASGAIYATVTMTALAFPTSEVALFIPPSYPINIQTGVGCLVMLDVLGVLRGWR
jgi:rhomboid-like protein